jgi:hypothetical protein
MMPKSSEIEGVTDEIAGAHWNFEPCKARHVRVIVGKSTRDTWWCAGFEGQERAAIEVEYHGTKFYIDADDEGLEKLTVGRGSPAYGHSSLPVASVIDPSAPMSTEEKLAAWADGLELRAKFLSEADEDDWREEAGASVSVMNGAAAELRRLSAEVQKLRADKARK